jgi:RHS repeat-associated protein
VASGNGTSTSYAYDRAGNQNFQVTGSATTPNDRVSYYAADGTLRFAETRSISGVTGHRLTWEEYRYDPLGRRILVRARRWCDYIDNREECSFDTIRRTVWDGDQVLYEIQMEDSDVSRENDTERSIVDYVTNSTFDGNVRVGRVLLTHGPGMDQPLSVIRMNYGEQETLQWPAFAVIPIWNTQGRAPYVMFSDGQRTLAHPTYPTLKLGTWWLLAKEAYGPANNAEVTSSSEYDQVWLGSVMEDQQDASGLLYRRNRYYDPGTGRFTQEDPIGLAGGLNLYGFANGDPVTYSDPYGLAASEDGGDCCRKLALRLGEIARGPSAHAVLREYDEEIHAAGNRWGVDPGLIKAVLYEEMTHQMPGEDFLEAVGMGSTIGLGQVTEGKYGYSRSDLMDPGTNIRAVATHLRFVTAEDPVNPTRLVASWATTYNCNSCTSVSGYGTRVEGFYKRWFSNER